MYEELFLLYLDFTFYIPVSVKEEEEEEDNLFGF
jgi:hypothetical protein